MASRSSATWRALSTDTESEFSSGDASDSSPSGETLRGAAPLFGPRCAFHAVRSGVT